MAGPSTSVTTYNAKKRKPAGCIEETPIIQRLLGSNSAWLRIWNEDIEGEDIDSEIAFSPQGRYAAVSLQGGSVLIWDLSTLPHVVLRLDLPPHMPLQTQATVPRRSSKSRGRGGRGRGRGGGSSGDRAVENDVEYVVVGLSWSSRAHKLLVTYHQRGGGSASSSYLCLWHLPSAAVEGHAYFPDCLIGPAQLSPVDDSLCAYFLSGSVCLRLQHLRGSQPAQEGREVLLSPSREGAGGTLGSGDGHRLGLCAFGRDGRSLFCVSARERRVFKVDTDSLAVLARSPEILAGAKLVVLKTLVSRDGSCLFVFSNRAAHLLETHGLRAAEAVGDFGAIKVEWGCWSVGPSRNLGPGEGGGSEEERRDLEQLVVVGVPCPFSRDSVQERLFIWRVRRLGSGLNGRGGKGGREDEEDRLEGGETEGLPEVDASPDILPGFAGGLQTLELCPGRAAMLGGNCEGGLFLRQESFATGFPGPMYAPGYRILEANKPYLEREEELDRLVTSARDRQEQGGKGESEGESKPGAGVPAEARAARGRGATWQEGEALSTPEGEGGARLQLLPKPVPVDLCLEEKVVFPVRPFAGRADRRRALGQKEGKEGAGEGGRETGPEGSWGFRDFLPMPPALVNAARKRQALGAKGGIKGVDGGAPQGLIAPNPRFKAVESWAERGKEELKRALAGELAEMERERAGLGKGDTGRQGPLAPEKERAQGPSPPPSLEGSSGEEGRPAPPGGSLPAAPRGEERKLEVGPVDKPEGESRDQEKVEER